MLIIMRTILQITRKKKNAAIPIEMVNANQLNAHSLKTTSRAIVGVIVLWITKRRIIMNEWVNYQEREA